MVSLQNRHQSSTSAGLCTAGAAIGIGTWFQLVTTWPQWRKPISSFSRSMVSYFASSQRCQSRRASSLKEASVKLPPRLLSICQAMSCGCWPSALAMLSTMRLERSQKTSLLRQTARRVPSCLIRPRSSTGRISGCFRESQMGGAAVGVARTTLMPALPSRSMTRLSQAKSYLPSSGSQSPQVNSPMRTTLTPAVCISSTSRSQAASGFSRVPPYGINPLFRMIIYAEIHNNLSRCGLHCTLKTIPPWRKRKVAPSVTIPPLSGRRCQHHARPSRAAQPARAGLNARLFSPSQTPPLGLFV